MKKSEGQDLKKQVFVVGAGASGLMAAIQAAINGAAVTVLEQNDRPGRKICATGNGRCNMTNLNQDENAYRGSHPEFAKDALAQFPVEKTLKFFQELGICTTDRSGWIYPRSNQAQSVVDVLVMKARSLKVKLKTNQTVTGVSFADGQWKIHTDGWTYSGDAVILANGSRASSVAGSCESGYEIAKSLGHHLIEPLPALTALKCKGNSFSGWSGVRTEGKITLYIDGTPTVSQQGELQLTDYGVSGIPVFQISRYAIRAVHENKNVELSINFFPELNRKELEEYLEHRKAACPYKTEKELLIGLFPEKLIRVLCAQKDLIRGITDFRLPVKNGLSFEQAQVCSGGVDTSEVHSKTMESRLHKGLYFAGELLDIDGTCGGYNLQWAWSSGAAAGIWAAKEEEKMIRITQLKLPITHTEEQLHRKIAKMLRLGNQPFTYEIRKQSLDARHKEDKKFVYTVDIKLDNESRVLKKVHDKNIMLTSEKKYHFSSSGSEALSHRPIVIGSGPAGLFCAWYLAKAGYCPLVLERGEEADKRQKTVENFWKNGILDPDSNVQFGEGGAGTFSDGKLNTLVKDTFGRGREVLSRFVEAGAPSEILYQQKPHLGTDQLVGIVQFMRHQIEEMGGEFRFRSTVTDLMIRDRKLTAVIVNAKEEIPAEICILAPGHSARDTFAMLEKHNINMEPKSFAVGVRVEHPQTMINQDLYGEPENDRLGASSYKVTHTLENGRGVYSFCMCPGGYVVNASSEEGMLAVNGMSYQARDSHNANSAIIVTVNPSDFPEEGVLGGIALQRKLERAAWEAGKGKIPVQLFKDYCTHQKSTRLGDVIPCIKGAYTLTDVRSIFPKEIGDSIEAGIHAFGKKLSGFDRPDALLEGVESRTSSPVRIVREPKKLTSNIEGIYPCGEGAGYAGGITSAAMDGIKVAEAVASVYALPVNKM